MATEQEMQRVLQFLKDNAFGNLATVGTDGRPTVALVSYMVEKDWQLCVLTKSDSRKAANLRENNNVSMVVSDIPKMITVQMDGVVEVLDNPLEKLEMVKKMSRKIYDDSFFLTPLLKMESKGLMAMCVNLNWVKWSHFGKEKHGEVFEFNV